MTESALKDILMPRILCIPQSGKGHLGEEVLQKKIILKIEGSGKLCKTSEKQNSHRGTRVLTRKQNNLVENCE